MILMLHSCQGAMVLCVPALLKSPQSLQSHVAFRQALLCSLLFYVDVHVQWSQSDACATHVHSHCTAAYCTLPHTVCILVCFIMSKYVPYCMCHHFQQLMGFVQQRLQMLTGVGWCIEKGDAAMLPTITCFERARVLGEDASGKPVNMAVCCPAP